MIRTRMIQSGRKYRLACSSVSGILHINVKNVHTRNIKDDNKIMILFYLFEKQQKDPKATNTAVEDKH